MAPAQSVPPHSGFKWLKPAENKFTCCTFTKIPSKFQKIRIVFLSGNCVCFKFTVACIRMISQFNEFFRSNFRRVFASRPNCARSLATRRFTQCLDTTIRKTQITCLYMGLRPNGDLLYIFIELLNKCSLRVKSKKPKTKERFRRIRK